MRSTIPEDWLKGATVPLHHLPGTTPITTLNPVPTHITPSMSKGALKTWNNTKRYGWPRPPAKGWLSSPMLGQIILPPWLNPRSATPKRYEVFTISYQKSLSVRTYKISVSEKIVEKWLGLCVNHRLHRSGLNILSQQKKLVTFYSDFNFIFSTSSSCSF